MISIANLGDVYEYRGLSTDTKPKSTNGSIFIEIDTSKLYFYDISTSSWLEFTSPTSPTSGAIVGTSKVDEAIVG